MIVLVAAGCDRNTQRVERSPVEAVRAPAPAWLIPTARFFRAAAAPGESERVELRVMADGGMVLRGAERREVDADLDDVDRRLQARKSGDRFEKDLLAWRPLVALEVAPGTRWRYVRDVLHRCEARHHRRVLLRIGDERMQLVLPRNVSDYPSIPDRARVPLALSFDPRRSAPGVRFDGRWSGLASFRERIKVTTSAIRERPAVAVLEIGPDVRTDDVLQLFRILLEADIDRFTERLPPVPTDSGD